jgi:hypothetical protein
VIHVATVHWHDERWIEPQLRFLARHAGEHRVYASLNGVAPGRFDEFHFAADLDGSHPEKLNQLAEVISADADAQDLVLFLDGDAFPVGPVDASVLAGAPLAAVRRDENVGDRQPHPSFCLTTVAYWNEIGGDWREGHRWTASTGDEVTDVGGNLLGILEKAGATWRPLLRSNVVNLHPLWFGIYADVAYHHGAGFRRPLSRVDDLPGRADVRAARDASRIPSSIPFLGRVERSLRYRVASRQHQRTVDENVDEGKRLSDEVFGWITTEDDFTRRFLGR